MTVFNLHKCKLYLWKTCIRNCMSRNIGEIVILIYAGVHLDLVTRVSNYTNVHRQLAAMPALHYTKKFF